MGTNIGRNRNLYSMAFRRPERLLAIPVVLAASGSRGEHPLEIVAVVTLCVVAYAVLSRLAAGQPRSRGR